MSKKIVFETIAKKKVCPFIQLNEASNGGVTTEEQGIFKNVYCLGNYCMAWQYVEAQHFHGRKAYGDTSDKTEEGYCRRMICG